MTDSAVVDPVAKAIADGQKAHRIGHGLRLDGGVGGVSSLLRIQNDSEWQVERRRGRFAIPLDMLESPVHQNAAIKAMCLLFISNIKKSHGFEYLPNMRFGDIPGKPKGLIVSDPLEHVEFEATSLSWSELGVYEMPKPPGPGFSEDVYRNYAALCQQYEAAERKKAARTIGEGAIHFNQVDFIILGHFKHLVKPGFRLHIPHQHEASAQMGRARKPQLVTATR